MKKLTTNLKQIAATDKLIFVFMAGLLISASLLIWQAVLSVHPSNLRIWYRYASFGENYYNESWYYMIAFLVFGVVLAFLNNLIAVRIYSQKGRGATLLFLGLSIFSAILGLIVLSHVVGINQELI